MHWYCFTCFLSTWTTIFQTPSSGQQIDFDGHIWATFDRFKWIFCELWRNSREVWSFDSFGPSCRAWSPRDMWCTRVSVSTYWWKKSSEKSIIISSIIVDDYCYYSHFSSCPFKCTNIDNELWIQHFLCMLPNTHKFLVSIHLKIDPENFQKCGCGARGAPQQRQLPFAIWWDSPYGRA